MKKGMLAGVGLAVLLGGGAFGINSVFADSNTNTNQIQTVQAPQLHAGKRINFLNQNKDQIHQLNQMKEDRQDLAKQLIQKKDQLLDLFLAAKNSGNKSLLKQAKEVRPQIKSLNQDIKSLAKEGKAERISLKQAVKNNTSDGTDQLTKLISTQQQINEKMKERIAQLDKLIGILSAKTSS